jgi:hypothetical protein
MADETDKLITEFIKRLSTFWSRETEECPHCGQHAERLVQVERSVYARPCGYRQGQGFVPGAWNELRS